MTNNSTQQKKGLSPLAWVGIGCGGLVLLGVIAVVGLGVWGFGKAKEFAEDPSKIVELAVNADPNLEVVKNDADAGEFTYRNKSTGEEITISYEDIRNGKFDITTGSGTTSIDASEGNGGMKIKGADGSETVISGQDGGITVDNADGTKTVLGGAASMDSVPEWVPTYPNAPDTKAQFSSNAEGKTLGSFTGSTPDSLDDIEAFYKEKLEAAGFTVDVKSMEANGSKMTSVISAKNADTNSEVNVMATGQGGGNRRIQVTYSQRQ
ncbi:MAG: hypothetical protein R3F11_30930 [Verrucomicrobiales bacterium]